MASQSSISQAVTSCDVPAFPFPNESAGNLSGSVELILCRPNEGRTKEFTMVGSTITDLLQEYPFRAFYTLQEACSLKGVNTKTCQNKRWLMPSGGKPDAVVGGRNVWTRETVQEWINKDDQTLLAESQAVKP